MNLAEIATARAKLRSAVRSFFETRNYLEIETPILVDAPGCEVHLEYFSTDWVGHRREIKTKFLRSSPELHMKQALAAGLPRIFQLAPSFRNHGEMSPWHHPEFVMLEWYESGAQARRFFEETIALIESCHAAFASAGFETSPLPQSWSWLTVEDAFARFAGITLVDRDPNLATAAAAAGIVSINGDEDFETAFFKILLERVEPALANLEGVVLHDYPASQAALARIEDGVAQRYELYWRGVELSNGFDEVVDPAECKARVASVQEARDALDKTRHPVDHHFVAAASRGIPPCCGNALGFDRLLALILGKTDLDMVVPYRRQF